MQNKQTKENIFELEQERLPLFYNNFKIIRLNENNEEQPIYGDKFEYFNNNFSLCSRLYKPISKLFK